jgi:hypothetical protein
MAVVQTCGVANIYRVEDLLNLVTGEQPTSSSATYELSPRRHHHHQAATVIITCSLRRSGHPLSSHVKCDQSCRRACAPLFGHTPATSDSIARARPEATVIALDHGVLALAAWPAPRRQKKRIHHPAAGPRHCQTVGHHF